MGFLMRYSFRLLTMTWLVAAGPLQAQDLTGFGGFQHPGTLTLRSGVAGIGSTIGVQPGASPGEFQIDPKAFGTFGIRLYRSAAPLGLEHTVAMKVNLIGSASRSTPPLFLGFHATARSFLTPAAAPFSTARIYGWNFAPVDSGPTPPLVGASFMAPATGVAGCCRPAPSPRPYASFGSKYSFNYGAGLMVEFVGPLGLRFDARTYSIRGIDDHPLNLLEASTGIVLGF